MTIATSSLAALGVAALSLVSLAPARADIPNAPTAYHGVLSGTTAGGRQAAPQRLAYYSKSEGREINGGR